MLDPKKYCKFDYDHTEKVLEVKDLHIAFKTDHGIVHAVRGVSFDLHKGETLCLVGESGCGKSTVCKALMGILANEAIIEGGKAIYEGEDLTKISEEEFHRIRGHKIGMIFQDPLSSLNPIMKIGKQITEATLINKNILRQRYEELISKELIAYKNCVTEYRSQKQLLQEEASVFETDQKKLLSDKCYDMKKAGVNPNDISRYRSEKEEEIAKEVKKIKERNKVALVENKKKFKAAIPPLKVALSKRKKEARKENRIYLSDLKAETRKKLSEVNAELKKENNPEKKKELLAKKNAIHEEFVSKTKVTKKQAKEMALQVMREVGIPQPEVRFKQYPFEFSGGMRQRIVIAIALTANPQVLICDEPTTALDVTIQAQILELINRLKKERNMSIIFITHDLGVVANMADRVAVMYAGKIVEVGTAFEVFFEPKHPYTWALLSSIPDIDSKEKLEAIPGTPPNLVNPPKGDAFAPRNKYALAVDYEYEPPLFQLSPTHFCSSWLLYKDFAPNAVPPKIVTSRIEKALKDEVKYEQRKD